MTRIVHFRGMSLQRRDRMKTVAPPASQTAPRQTNPSRVPLGQTSQRVKVGMIGLAAVVLLIGIASAIFSVADRDRPIAVAGAPTAIANMAVGNTSLPVTASEPLAELGVAPSTVDANSSAIAGAAK